MATQTATIQVRIDNKTKQKARKVLDAVGLDLSSGIKLFLHNIAITHTFPLQIRTANGFTLEKEKEILEAREDARKNPKSYRTARELHEAILAEPDEK